MDRDVFVGREPNLPTCSAAWRLRRPPEVRWRCARVNRGWARRRWPLSWRAGSDGQRLRFAHALIQEVAYAELSMTQRQHLHRRAAHAIQAPDVATDGAGDELDALAHHLRLAAPLGDADVALRVTIQVDLRATAAERRTPTEAGRLRTRASKSGAAWFGNLAVAVVGIFVATMIGLTTSVPAGPRPATASGGANGWAFVGMMDAILAFIVAFAYTYRLAVVGTRTAPCASSTA